MPKSCLLLNTSLSRQPSRWAICLSAYPFCLASKNKSDVIFFRVNFPISLSKSIKSLICLKNQSSILVFC